jgi:hypothetical protein
MRKITNKGKLRTIGTTLTFPYLDSENKVNKIFILMKDSGVPVVMIIVNIE